MSSRLSPLFPSFHRDISMMRLNNLPQDAGNGVKETVIWKKDKVAWKVMLTWALKETLDS